MFINLLEESLNAPVDSFECAGLVILVAFVILLAHLLVLLFIFKMGNKNDKKNLTVLGPGHNVEFVRDKTDRDIR